VIRLTAEGERVLRDAVAEIEMDLEHWDQDYYVNTEAILPGGACGTTCCLAGQIVVNELGIPLGKLREWTNTSGVSIAAKAMTLLQLYFDDEYSGVAGSFRELIFNYTHVGPFALRSTPENLKFLKERIAEVTGIEL